MKNYVLEAKRLNLHIFSTYEVNTSYIQKYKINREQKYAEIRYMNGYYDRESLEDIKEDELEKRQLEDFRRIEKLVKDKTKPDIKFYSSISAAYFATGLLLALHGHSSVSVFNVWSTYFLIKAIRPLRLRKDIALTGWINDNKDKVTEVIREEVDSKREQITDNVSTNNVVIGKYPIDKVPYSEEMYDEGINLNNIDELNTKTLRKLKRKVLKREKRN